MSSPSVFDSANSTTSTLKAARKLSTDYEATLGIAQQSMETLNDWSSRISEISSSSDHEDVDFTGPLLLGHHIVKIIIFRAILRPFSDNYNISPGGDVRDQREVEACRLSRNGAKTCLAAATSFTMNMKGTWIHSFWPFCT